MTEADYEHECMRAELLGINKPSRDEFFSRKHDNIPQITIDEEDVKLEVVEELHSQGENIGRAAGGLDEINNILSVTQKKINHLKTVCGSFTSILKLKSYSNKGDHSDGERENTSGRDVFTSYVRDEDAEENEAKMVELKQSIQSDVESAVGTQISKIDSIILKAEKANLSLARQNKQMRNILKK